MEKEMEMEKNISGSIGWANFNGYNYLTIGLSLELAALAGILFFWWW